MRSCSDAHDPAPQGHRQDFGAVYPSNRIDEGVYREQIRISRYGLALNVMLTVSHCEQVYSQNGEAFAYFVIRILERSLHHGAIDFDDDNPGEPREKHPVDPTSQPDTTYGHIFKVTDLRRPHLSGRKSVDIVVAKNAQVPQTAASARIVFASIPRDLYRVAR